MRQKLFSLSATDLGKESKAEAAESENRNPTETKKNRHLRQAAKRYLKCFGDIVFTYLIARDKQK